MVQNRKIRTYSKKNEIAGLKIGMPLFNRFYYIYIIFKNVIASICHCTTGEFVGNVVKNLL